MKQTKKLLTIPKKKEAFVNSFKYLREKQNQEISV